MKALRVCFIGLAMALPQAAPAAEEGPPAASAPARGDAAPAGNEAKGAGEKAAPQAPAKRELDVSRMLFDAESIRQVVSFHMPEIQECYEGVLAETGKKIEGKVVVSAVIDSEGRVTSAKPLPKKSTLREPRVVECVLAMRGWAFPKPGDNRDHPIEYPFALSVRK